MVRLYDRIRDICEKRGMSVSALENACGFKHCSIQKWNKSAPSAYKLKAVCQVLDVSMDSLLREEETDETA